MRPGELPREVVDQTAYDGAVRHLGAAGARLPTFRELADPSLIPAEVAAETARLDPAEPGPANLFRIHWFNDEAGTGTVATPGHIVLGRELTGVATPIAVALGDRFPMIGAHKVLAAYACLVSRLITGRFDPKRNRAIWPSTGNYCRGGVAIGRILGCRSVAVLPEGMSAERFEWLQRWINQPEDIIRTPGSESNVKEIYDACDELAADPTNVILNQFSEFANYLGHFRCTGAALESVFRHLRDDDPGLELAAFVAGTGSGGTLAAGDYLKAEHGARIVAVEPTECPTMLYNGYGAHNIQGIGDKHIPLIQNVMNTDAVAGVSDAGCDRLNVLFNTDAGRAYLTGRQGIDPGMVGELRHLGLSGIANVLAAIKTARYFDLTEKDLIVTVATDSSVLYDSEREKSIATDFGGEFDTLSAAETFARCLMGVDGDHYLETGHRERRRIFNLGYFTWVEQRGVELEDFDRRADQRFWKALQEVLPVWDEMIDDFNARTGV
ncbi:MAG: pyridoxal-phosphate dependent enzyme [Pseudomonadota bacterium]|nr:pyridoxal-phosphate dependent enzyme [Pseudomonadota bacterium]